MFTSNCINYFPGFSFPFSHVDEKGNKIVNTEFQAADQPSNIMELDFNSINLSVLNDQALEECELSETIQIERGTLYEKLFQGVHLDRLRQIQTARQDAKAIETLINPKTYSNIQATLESYEQLLQENPSRTREDEDYEEPLMFLEDYSLTHSEALPKLLFFLRRFNAAGLYQAPQIVHEGSESSPVETGHVSTALLDENLKTAEKIVKYVTSQVFYSTNKHDRPSTIRYVEETFQKEEVPLTWEDAKTVRDGYFDNPDKKYWEESDFAWVQYLAEQAKYTGVGNCDIMAFLGHDFVSPSAEIFQIEGGDHIFLVVGRNLDSSAADYKNWGSDAVICDPWAEKYYPASKLEDLLENYDGVTGCTEPFNKARHTLAFRF